LHLSAVLAKHQEARISKCKKNMRFLKKDSVSLVGVED
jgi:hypothetical protein